MWWMLAAAGGCIHAGTALLRLDTFFPYPKLVDFAAFFAGAYALSQGQSPYALTPELLATLRGAHGLSVTVPAFVYPPLWGYMVQPFTLLRFPQAALAWLLLLLLLLACSARLLVLLAGSRDWRAWALALVLLVTFGPTFLALTLGQTSPFLLLALLQLGKAISTRRDAWRAPACLSLLPAFASKLFPLAWLGVLPFVRERRLVALAVIVIALSLGGSHLLAPKLSEEYWMHVLPQRVFRASTQVSLDDQALVPWLLRLGRPGEYVVPGLSLSETHRVVWSPSWHVSSALLSTLGYSLLALAGACCLRAALRAGESQREGVLYLWALYLLLVIPHMERYQHVLILPAIAWLWGRGSWRIGVAAYLLAGLSRLTHLWALVLPPFLGVLASGFGTVAVVLLGWRLYRVLTSQATLFSKEQDMAQDRQLDVEPPR